MQFNHSLQEKLKEGKIGLVIVHAANNAFGGWKEYNQMIGMGWRGNNGGDRLHPTRTEGYPRGERQRRWFDHRYTGHFVVTIRDADHPVTKGRPREWLHGRDELYDNMRGPIENAASSRFGVLKGTKVHEPMIWTGEFR